MPIVGGSRIVRGGAGGGHPPVAVPGGQPPDGSIGTSKLADGSVTNAKVNAAAAIAYSKLALAGSIVNADIAAGAAVAYSKLALTGSIVNADISASAAIALSKLAQTAATTGQAIVWNGTAWAPGSVAGGSVPTDGTTIDANGAGSSLEVIGLPNSVVTNAKVAAAAAIAYSKLALAGSIVNADIAAGAAIAYSKLALSGSIVNADIAAGAAISYSKLSLANSIATGDIANGAVTAAKLASGAAPDFFDSMAANAANAWVAEGPVRFDTDVITGGSKKAGQYVQVEGTSTGQVGIAGQPFVSSIAGTLATAWAAGDKWEVVFKFRVVGFANLSASQVACVGLTDIGNADPTTSTTNKRRIAVGVTSTGSIRVITCDGTSVTNTDTTLTAVSGTAYRVKMVWTKGTNVVVTIDANAPTTVTATLPTYLEAHYLACGSCGVATVCDAHVFGGAWRITTA